MDSQIMNALPDPVCVIDLSGKIVSSNFCFQSQVLKEHKGGFANILSDILHSDNKKALLDTIDSIRTGSRGPFKLGPLKTLTFTGDNQFPIYKIVDWSVGVIDENHLVLSGRLFETKGDDDGSAYPEVKYLVEGEEKKFQITNSEFVDFFQKAPIALHWLSGTGHVLWANDTEIESLGYSRDEYIGHSITEFLMPGEEGALNDVFGRLSSGKVVRNAPFRFRAKNGDIKYLVVDSNVNFNEDGSFRHTRCFIRNDNERRVHEAILETDKRCSQLALKAKDKFIRRIFHEIRTPLHVMSGILNTSDSQSLLQSDVNDLSRNLDGILGIVEDLAFATMFEVGKVSPQQPAPVHLPTLLSDVVDAVRSVEQLGGRYVNVSVHTDGVPSGAMANSMLRRVLFNLVSNAMRFTLDGGNVEIRVTYSSGGYGLDNSDEEDGDEQVRKRAKKFRAFEGFRFMIKNTAAKPLDLNEVNKYFQSYYHNDSSLATQEASKTQTQPTTQAGYFSEELQSSHGLGLGLHVSYNMLQLMGGLLECSGSAKESKFWFTLKLPLVDAQPPQSAPLHVFARVPAVISPPSTPSYNSACDIVDTAAAAMHVALDSPTSTLSATTTNSATLSSSSSSSIPSSIAASAFVAGPDTDISLIKTVDGSERRMRVLVVDDSPICQKMVIRALAKYDFDTDVACNGREACDKLTFKPCLYDAVLMDLRMPIMDGIEATKYCREVLELRSLPIIALTAELGSDTREAVLSAGANQLVGKPAQTKQLVEALKNCYEAQF